MVKMDFFLERNMVSICLNNFEHQFYWGYFQKISCLHDSTMMEVMWGLKNCMHHFVPAELAKDDRPLMSEGVKRVLDKYHFDYKPEIVSSSPYFPYSLM
jgi:hypothetical protein